MVPDNYDMWKSHDRAHSKAEEQAPHCAWCGAPLGDTYYQINGSDVCEECIDGCRRYA